MFCLDKGDKVDSLKKILAGMKRPLSPVSQDHKPSASPESSISHRHGDTDPQPKRVRKCQTLTLCEVCNIHLNSRAQAQTHYSGKSHQRRLRKASQGNTASGSPIQGSPLMTSLPLPGRPLQSLLDLKHFLSPRVNGSVPFSLFPNFHTVDPIQKAVINHTLGPVKKKQISCNTCHLCFNSTSQAEAHFRGHKHAFITSRDLNNKKRLAESTAYMNTGEADAERSTNIRSSESFPLDTAPPLSLWLTCGPLGSSSLGSSSLGSECSSDMCSPHPTGETSCPGAAEEAWGKISKQNIHCAVCKVTVNSISQLEAHFNGSKHKLMMEGQCVQPQRWGGKVVSSHMNPRHKRHGSKNNAISINQSHHCDVCNIAVNSETQLKQHMSSRRHKDRIAGKSPKPKFSRYTKSRTNSVFMDVGLAGLSCRTGSALQGMYRSYSLTTVTPQTRIALQKELSKTLTTGFLPSPLTPATLCTMAANPLTLRYINAPTAIIHAPLVNPTIFQPSPGPLRTSHAPVIFTPY